MIEQYKQNTDKDRPNLEGPDSIIIKENRFQSIENTPLWIEKSFPKDPTIDERFDGESLKEIYIDLRSQAIKIEKERAHLTDLLAQLNTAMYFDDTLNLRKHQVVNIDQAIEDLKFPHMRPTDIGHHEDIYIYIYI